MKIVFFDGECNLCNFWVDWLIRWDKKQILKFASLQGETAKKKSIFNSHSERIETVQSLVYLREDQIFHRSTAILKILGDLGGIWSSMKVLLFIPRALRDFIYQSIATNRYKLFGKRSSCRIPTAAEKSRFLD